MVISRLWHVLTGGRDERADVEAARLSAQREVAVAKVQEKAARLDALVNDLRKEGAK